MRYYKKLLSLNISMHTYGPFFLILLFYFHWQMYWEEGIATAWREITVLLRDGPVDRRLALWAFAPSILFLVIP